MAAPHSIFSNTASNQAPSFPFKTFRPRADSLCDPAGIEEAELITYVLNSTTPEDLYGRLKTYVDPSSAYSQFDFKFITQALSSIGYAGALKKGQVAVKDDVDRHCLRCHATYLEKDNARDACNVTQVLDQDAVVPVTRNIARRHTTNMVAAHSSKPLGLKSCMENGCFHHRALPAVDGVDTGVQTSGPSSPDAAPAVPLAPMSSVAEQSSDRTFVPSAAAPVKQASSLSAQPNTQAQPPVDAQTSRSSKVSSGQAVPPTLPQGSASPQKPAGTAAGAPFVSFPTSSSSAPAAIAPIKSTQANKGATNPLPFSFGRTWDNVPAPANSGQASGSSKC